MNNPTRKARKTAITAFAIAALAVLALLPASSRATGSVMDEGQTLFKTKCAACHGTDGSGNTAMGKQLGVRSLRSPEVQKQSDAQLFGIISAGKKKMPAFSKSLTDDQRHHLVAYIRSLAQ